MYYQKYQSSLNSFILSNVGKISMKLKVGSNENLSFRKTFLHFNMPSLTLRIRCQDLMNQVLVLDKIDFKSFLNFGPSRLLISC